MRQQTLMSFLTLILSFIVALPVSAQLENRDDAGAMLFGSWDTTVTTVSKKAEDISEAPAVVSIITAEDINNFGVQTLREVFQFIPGVNVADTYWKGPIITFRGVNMTLYNDKALMLINGIPAYEAVNGEYYPELVPINAIERIEVIRGPGSVLYGTNAFSGVINIITKTGSEDEGAGVTTFIKAGSFSDKEVGFTFGKEFAEDVSLFAAVSFKDDDGYDWDTLDELGNMGELNYENDILSVHLQAAFKGLKFTTNYMDHRFNVFGITPHHNRNGGPAIHKAINLSLEYNYDFSEQLSMTSYVRFNDTSREHNVNLYPNYITPSLDLIAPGPNYTLYEGELTQGEIRFSYEVSDALSMMAGFTVEDYDVSDVFTALDNRGDSTPIPGYDGALVYPPPSNTEMSAFFQVDYSAESYSLVAGVRYTDSELSDTEHLTPRMGFVYHVTDDVNLKLLYGQAFRSPAYVEKYFKITNAIYGNDDIEEETISTYELALDFPIGVNHSAQLNYYYLTPEDTILRRALTSAEISSLNSQGILAETGLIYDNIADQKIQGLEFEVKGDISETVKYFYNISLRDGEEKIQGTSGYEDIDYLEKVLANASVIFSPTESLTIAPNIQYVGEREGTLNNGTKNTVDAYTKLNCVVEYTFESGLAVKVECINIFDEEYEYPERVRNNIATIPGGPGRSGYLTVKYEY